MVKVIPLKIGRHPATGLTSSPQLLPVATAAVLTPLVEPLATTGEVLFFGKNGLCFEAHGR